MRNPRSLEGTIREIGAVIPFELFTLSAQRALNLAKDEAGSPQVAGSRQLLLGLMRVRDGIAYRTLASLDVDFDRLQSQLSTSNSVATYQEARSVFVRAQEIASRSGADSIGTQHLLLALVENREGPTSLALTSLGIDSAKVKSTIEQLQLEEGFSEC